MVRRVCRGVISFIFAIGDELLSDLFLHKEIENDILWEVEGKWVVQGAVDVDIGANPSVLV